MSSRYAGYFHALRNVGDTVTFQHNTKNRDLIGSAARHYGYRNGKRLSVKTTPTTATIRLVKVGIQKDRKAIIRAQAHNLKSSVKVQEIKQYFIGLRRMDLQREKARRIRKNVEYWNMEPRRAMMEARETLYALSGERL